VKIAAIARAAVTAHADRRGSPRAPSFAREDSARRGRGDRGSIQVEATFGCRHSVRFGLDVVVVDDLVDLRLSPIAGVDDRDR
jgi:hypothetical protein